MKPKEKAQKTYFAGMCYGKLQTLMMASPDKTWEEIFKTLTRDERWFFQDYLPRKNELTEINCFHAAGDFSVLRMLDNFLWGEYNDIL